MPFYQEGDFVVVLKIPFFFNWPKEGDIVVFRHPMYGMMIKQVLSLSADHEEIFVYGTHPDSTDSRHFGSIQRGDLAGKVIWHIKQS